MNTNPKNRRAPAEDCEDAADTGSAEDATKSECWEKARRELKRQKNGDSQSNEVAQDNR